MTHAARRTLCLALLAACGGDSGTTATVASVRVEPSSVLIVGVGGAETVGAQVLDASGEAVAGVSVTWMVDDRAVATIDGSGIVTAVGAGVTTVTATAGGVSDDARLEVWAPATVSFYHPDSVYFGRGGYVEYRPGRLPLILSAGHGGDQEPAEIPNRTFGTLVVDLHTIETAEAVRDALIAATGHAPHLVISHLRRTKLDPNREIVEGAQDNPFAALAWEEYHGFLLHARDAVSGTGSQGLYLDVHGHGHAIDRVEIGYLLSADDLDQPDANLNSLAVVQKTSIREMGREQRIPFSQLIRGPTSLGGYLEAEGIAAVPSPAVPSPGDDPYFTGGYSIERHGSMGDTQLVSGIQLELHRAGIRDTEENRTAFGAALARVVEAYMLEQFGFFAPGGGRSR